MFNLAGYKILGYRNMFISCRDIVSATIADLCYSEVKWYKTDVMSRRCLELVQITQVTFIGRYHVHPAGLIMLQEC